MWLGVAACSSRSSEWNLPIKLGASKSEVYSALGRPSNTVAENVEWFQNSGLAIDYDPAGHVSTVIVHGQSNSGFITYDKPVIYGLRVTDKLDRLSAVLGKPLSVEDDPVDTYLESQGAKKVLKQSKIYKWRRQPYFIEAAVWIADVTEGKKVYGAGTIKSLEIGKAVGGQ